MGGIFMSKENQFTHRIISDFLGGKMKRCQAAELLQVRERTVTREKLASEHKIEVSYSVFRRWCHEKKLVKRKKRRSSTVRRSRVRMANEGLLLQMDGSHHKWNGEQPWCLIAAIDDATSDIPYGEFFLSEDTLNCMTVMQRIIDRRGIPTAIYVDKAGWFGGMKRQQFCQFKPGYDRKGLLCRAPHTVRATSNAEGKSGLRDGALPQTPGALPRRVRQVVVRARFPAVWIRPSFVGRLQTAGKRTKASAILNTAGEVRLSWVMRFGREGHATAHGGMALAKASTSWARSPFFQIPLDRIFERMDGAREGQGRHHLLPSIRCPKATTIDA